MDSSLPPQPPPPPPPFASPPPSFASPPPLRPKRPGRGWKIATFILAGVLLLIIGFSILDTVLSLVAGGGHSGGPRLEESTTEYNHSPNKIAVVPVEGIITSMDPGSVPMAKLIDEQLKWAARDDRVKAVILKVNSPGGEVMASDDIHNAIAKFQKETGKPVVASMSSLAASGGYYVSAPCRWIVANELTITGSIGVIMQAYNYRGLMDKVGLRPETFKSGKFKDMLSGSKAPEEITQEERDMVQRLVNETFEKFKSIVAQGRQNANDKNKNNKDSSGQKLSERWADYADGRVLSGTEAFKLGFVDELGNFDAAVKRARKLAEISDANLVQYQPVFDLSNLFRLLGQSDAKGVKVDLGLDFPRLQAGYLYFLSPTYVR
jgi:protease-4